MGPDGLPIAVDPRASQEHFEDFYGRSRLLTAYLSLRLLEVLRTWFIAKAKDLAAAAKQVNLWLTVHASSLASLWCFDYAVS